MKKLFFPLLLIFAVIGTYGQNAKKLVEKYDDLYFKFAINDKTELNTIPSYISIDAVKGDTVYAYVNKYNYKKLNDSGINYVPIDKAGNTKSLTMATTVADMANWDRYPTYDVYVQMMQNFANNYPQICRLDTIGYSQNGHMILVLKITDNPDVSENEPEFFYTSTMHGDETAGYVFMLRLIDKLLSGYGTDSTITNLVDNMEIWINPLANPDGTYNGGDDDVSNATRYLADGKDPNRDFPDPTGNQHPSGAWSQETVEMMDFASEHNFTMSANFHGGAEVANYPWDVWTTNDNPHADDTWWQYVAGVYAQSAINNSPSGYFTGVASDGTIEGGDWYIVSGSRQDYMNYYKHCREMTVELSNTKLLDVEDLNAYWGYNEEALMLYMEQALYGFHGVVTDGCSGDPVVAKIEILNHDRDGSEVYSSADVGDYHRPVYAGTYDIIITAPGYDTTYYSNITINNNQSIELNATLNPLPVTADYTLDTSNICNGEVFFYNLSQGATNITWNFGDGTVSNETNPIHVYTQGGVYNVTLTVENNCGDIDSTSFSLNVTRPNVYATDVYTCGSSDITLSASGDGNIYWFTDSNSVNYTYSGTSLTISNITADTTVYVQSIIEGVQATGGENRINTGGSLYSGSSTHGLYFDVYQPVILKSVNMNAGSAGEREIAIYDSDGSVIFDTTVSLIQGIQTVNLNANLPAGDSLLIKCLTPSPNLFRNNTGNSYPYEIGNLIAITTSTANQGYYYFFYNWVVKTPDCKSIKKPVNVFITDQPPVADFSYTFSGNGYQFINNSVGATSYYWDFGDGTTSTEVSPFHVYQAADTYTVTLIAENDCGSDTTQQVITFTGNENVDLTAFSIYPVPARNYITVKSGYPVESISIYTADGILAGKYLLNGNKDIDITNLPKGVYILKVLYQNGKSQESKFIKVE